jgi:DNA mismatch repair ATPase MutS
LKEILDPVREGKPVFFLIDEMLKGTNAADRQVGSMALLRQTARRMVSGIVATHDLQLTDLEMEFPGRVLNFHFDGRVEDDRLLFDFLLRPGRCESFNALILMKKMGIEV